MPIHRKPRGIAPAGTQGRDTLDATADGQTLHGLGGRDLLRSTFDRTSLFGDGGWDRLTYDDEPGLSLETMPWLHEHGVAAVAADNWAFEALPSGCDIWLPIHAVGIVHMGLMIGEFFDLEALAGACAQDGRYAFLLTAAPLPLVGAVGSPVNPIAVR